MTPSSTWKTFFGGLRENAKLEPGLRQNPLAVTLTASLEIRSSITFATFIIMLVFVPLFFLSGVEGRLLAPLGVAYVVSLFASLIVAASVTPVLCSLLLPNSKGVTEGEESPVVRRLKSAYQRTLTVVIRRPRLIIGVALRFILNHAGNAPVYGPRLSPGVQRGHVDDQCRDSCRGLRWKNPTGSAKWWSRFYCPFPR